MNVGNVYANAHGRPFYRIVLSTLEDQRERRFNRVVCVHVAATGDIVGCSMQPVRYMSEHHDHVGTVDPMPNFKIDWLREETP